MDNERQNRRIYRGNSRPQRHFDSGRERGFHGKGGAKSFRPGPFGFKAVPQTPTQQAIANPFGFASHNAGSMSSVKNDGDNKVKRGNQGSRFVHHSRTRGNHFNGRSFDHRRRDNRSSSRPQEGSATDKESDQR